MCLTWKAERDAACRKEIMPWKFPEIAHAQAKSDSRVSRGVFIEPAADSSINAPTVAEWTEKETESEAGMQRSCVAKGGRVPRQRGGHFIKRRPSCGQINAFPLRTNKFPRDADDDDNNKCQQKTKYFSLSLFLLHHHLLVVVELLLVPLLLLHFWLPTALARLGAKHGQQQSWTSVPLADRQFDSFWSIASLDLSLPTRSRNSRRRSNDRESESDPRPRQRPSWAEHRHWFPLNASKLKWPFQVYSLSKRR